jgi:hypothetical protein
VVIIPLDCISSSRIRMNEFIDLFEIHKYDIPMPKDITYVWSFEIRDYKNYELIKKGKYDWKDLSRKASIIFMATGQNEVYRYWIKENKNTSNGITRIDVCDKPDDIKIKCEFGQIEYHWEKTPVRIDDGKTYLICEIKQTFEPARIKQVILCLRKSTFN